MQSHKKCSKPITYETTAVLQLGVNKAPRKHGGEHSPLPEKDRKTLYRR